MRVLIVRLDHLGDVILTTPLIRAAVKAGHEVHALVRENYAAPLEGNAAVTTHLLERVSPGFPGSWPRLGGWMRRMKFDTILLPHARPPQLLLASALSGARRRIAMWGGIPGRLTLHRCLRSGIQSGTRHFSDILLDCARGCRFSHRWVETRFLSDRRGDRRGSRGNGGALPRLEVRRHPPRVRREYVQPAPCLLRQGRRAVARTARPCRGRQRHHVGNAALRCLARARAEPPPLLQRLRAMDRAPARRRHRKLRHARRPRHRPAPHRLGPLGSNRHPFSAITPPSRTKSGAIKPPAPSPSILPRNSAPAAAPPARAKTATSKASSSRKLSPKPPSASSGKNRSRASIAF